MRSDRTCAAPGGGQEVLTYSARVSEPERRRRPRPELKFSLERSLFGEVIRTCEGQVLSDLARHASEFQGAGALAVISRQRSAFSPSQSEALQPLAEVLAFAFVAQQQQHALEKFQMMESMSDTTFALASEINGALQAVVGEAAILRRQHPQLGEELDQVIHHAERTLALLERMRAAARERLGEADLTAAIPSGPEAFGEED